MGASRVFFSQDRKALVAWKRGIIQDRIQFAVDGIVLAEEGWAGLDWPNERMFRFSGLGYSAVVIAGWEGKMSTIKSCQITKSPGS